MQWYWLRTNCKDSIANNLQTHIKLLQCLRIYSSGSRNQSKSEKSMGLRSMHSTHKYEKKYIQNRWRIFDFHIHPIWSKLNYSIILLWRRRLGMGSSGEHFNCLGLESCYCCGILEIEYFPPSYNQLTSSSSERFEYSQAGFILSWRQISLFGLWSSRATQTHVAP